MIGEKKLVIGITAPLSVVLLEGQLKFFRDLGYKVFLLAPEEKVVLDFCKSEDATLLPVDIVRNISIIKDIKALAQIIKHLRKVKPDIVNVGTPKMGLLGIISSYLTGVRKRIYTCRGFRYEHERGLKREVLIFMEKITSGLSNKIICISPSVKQMGITENIFPQAKAIVFGRGSSNGINLDRFSMGKINKMKKTALAKKLGVENKFVYGFVGRIVDRKGIKELFYAFEHLSQEYQDLHLIIVGKANLEQVSDKTLIDKMDQHPGITLTGFQEDIPLFMSLFDVFVLPAWWEGFGNTLIQAAAMGLPIISTNVTGCKDAVSDGFNGVLIREKSVEELKEKMELFFLNKSYRNYLGQNGIQWAREFDSLIIWEGMKKLYEDAAVV